MTPKEALEKLLTAEKIEANWFADISRSQAFAAQIEQIITNLK